MGGVSLRRTYSERDLSSSTHEITILDRFAIGSSTHDFVRSKLVEIAEPVWTLNIDELEA